MDDDLFNNGEDSDDDLFNNGENHATIDHGEGSDNDVALVDYGEVKYQRDMGQILVVLRIEDYSEYKEDFLNILNEHNAYDITNEDWENSHIIRAKFQTIRDAIYVSNRLKQTFPYLQVRVQNYLGVNINPINFGMSNNSNSFCIIS